MADIVSTLAALRVRLQSFTDLPLYYPNDSGEPSIKNAPNGFVYSEAQVLDERPISLGPNGGRMHRDFGEFMIYVNVPRNTKAGTAEGYAQTIRNLFGMTDVAGVVITRKTIQLGTIVESSDGRLWSVPLRIEWFADRTE